MARLLPLLLAAVCLLSLILPSHAVYFHVTEGVRRCFLEEVPEDTLLLARYSSPDHSKLNDASDSTAAKNVIRVTVTDPRQNVLLTHDVQPEGRFAFTSVVGGEHLICLQTITQEKQSRVFVSQARMGRFLRCSQLQQLTHLCDGYFSCSMSSLFSA
jgi:hypothetical protein